MDRQFQAATVRARLGDARHHVGQPGGAVIGAAFLIGNAERVVARGQRGFRPGLVGHHHIAAEKVRIGDEDRAFGAIKLGIGVVVFPDIPTGRQGDGGAIGEFQQGVDVGRRLDRDQLATAGFRGDGAGGRGGGCQSADPFDRTQELDQVGDIIGANIQHRARTRQKEEIRVGVPHFHAVAHHMA